MKYKELEDTIANLRSLADWLETNPRAVELPAMSFSPYVGVHEYEKDEDGNRDYTKVDEFATRSRMRDIARILAHGGMVEKRHSGDSFQLSKQFGEKKYATGTITMRFSTQRSAVCRKVVKSTKIIPAETRVIPERIEEEVEWVCTDSLLASDRS